MPPPPLRRSLPKPAFPISRIFDARFGGNSIALPAEHSGVECSTGRLSTSLGDRVAQGRLQHLAGVVLRQFGQEHISTGALEAGNAMEAVRVKYSLERGARR